MTATLAIAVAQPAVVALDVAANAHAHADAIRAADAGVIVLPEPSLTGCELAAPGLATADPRLWPIVATDTAALGIDADVAGTVKHADEAALQHERARRIAAEHGRWVAITSFAGPTGGGYHETAAQSGVWFPDGLPACLLDARAGRIGRTTPVRT